MRDSSSDAPFSYINGLFAAEDATLSAIRASAPAALAGMMVSPGEAALLAWLARNVQAARAVEIGTFVGYSTLWLWRALAQPHALLHAIEHDPRHAALARDNLAGTGVQLHEGAALDILPTLATDGPYDMVFVDADKRNYPAYVAWAAENLRAGGLLCVDNTLHFGAVDVASDTPPATASARAGWEAVRAVNAELAHSAQWHSILIPTQGGLTVAIKA